MAEIAALRLVVAVGTAGLGSAVAVTAKRISHLGLCLLISFAAGSLLAAALFHILPESVNLLGLPSAVVSALTGYFLFFFINRFVYHICPACAATHTEINFKALTWTMVLALAIHSFMDGLAITSGFLVGTQIGPMVLIAVAYHKLPEGMALTLVALGSGMSRAKAFLLTLALEFFTTLAGGIVGFLALPPPLIFTLGVE